MKSVFEDKDLWLGLISEQTYVSERDRVQLAAMNVSQLILIEELLHRLAVKIYCKTGRR